MIRGSAYFHKSKYRSTKHAHWHSLSTTCPAQSRRSSHCISRIIRSGSLLLCAALLGGPAFTSSAHADLKLCNTTHARIGVAVGYQDPKGWATEGWWTIPSKTCEILLKGKLPSRYYYVHAIDYDRGGEWDGPSKMCTARQSFIIRGVENCIERGYKQSGFFEVDTGNEQSWTIRLSDPAAKSATGLN